jgi:hypothetical protein
MPGDYFWQCVESLAAALDGGHAAVEDSLIVYEQACLQLSPEKRAEVRRQMIGIIGGLSRLETRLAEHDHAANHQPATRH